MASDRDEQREREMAFSEALRQKAKSGRPNLEDLLNQEDEEPENEEEKSERER